MEFYTHSKKHAKSMKLKVLNEVAKSICKLYVVNNIGTGFFLQVKLENGDIFYMLVSASHVFHQQIIEDKRIINIFPDVEKTTFNIEMDKEKRKIITLRNKNKDIIGIEIKEEDNIINTVKFLNYDINCKKDNYKNYLEKDAFIMHHPNGRALECNSGKILKLNDDEECEFHHTLDTDQGSSGAPILLFEEKGQEPKVIGVHRTFPSIHQELKTNKGTFIDILIDKLKNVLKEK